MPSFRISNSVNALFTLFESIEFCWVFQRGFEAVEKLKNSGLSDYVMFHPLDVVDIESCALNLSSPKSGRSTSWCTRQGLVNKVPKVGVPHKDQYSSKQHMVVHDQHQEASVESEPGNQVLPLPKTPLGKRPREYEDDYTAKERKLQKGILLAVNKPSYCLKQGVGSLQCEGESLRSQDRKRLWTILNKLLLQHNWAEASGVLNVLLTGTLKDPSISRNRAKYRAALELLHHINGGNISSRRSQSVYELWMKKISLKNRFAVRIEVIIFCLQRGSTNDAYQAAQHLMQEQGFVSDPISNLVVGLVFYQQWYSDLPEELQLAHMDANGISRQSEVVIDGVHMSSDFTKENDTCEVGTGSPLKSNSDTCIANNKAIEDGGYKQNEYLDSNENCRREASSRLFIEPQERDMHSSEASGHSDYSFRNDRGDVHHASIFDSQSLPRWLLPLKLPESRENLEDTIYEHRKLQNDVYWNALKHLRVALYSTPPVIEAFHPLIQLLLLGDLVNEALDEVENFSHSSDSILQLRLEASLLEHFDGGNYVKLSTCYEKTLKKDPTCRDSLSKLVLMHQRGEYDTQNLVEMIALHLDAARGICDTWKELASGLLKLSQCEADRVSACYDGNDQYAPEYLDTCNKIPELLSNGESGKAWRFRCRWWLNRHFNYKNLMSDIASGDTELVTYKASAASHLYGRRFNYVLKATECLEKENNMEQLYSVLQMHVLNSVGFCSVKRNT